ncbi:MAG: AtpZ/AtpI family protein [Flavobacterium sp.]
MEPTKKKKPLNEYVKYSSYTFQMASIIFVFMFIGQKADSYFTTEKPYLTAFFSILGIILSIFKLIKDVKSDT